LARLKVAIVKMEGEELDALLEAGCSLPTAGGSLDGRQKAGAVRRRQYEPAE
jgi:hypothetical protein